MVMEEVAEEKKKKKKMMMMMINAFKEGEVWEDVGNDGVCYGKGRRREEWR